MADINQLLDKIRTAVHGRDVQQSIIDAIQQCYDDVSTPGYYTPKISSDGTLSWTPSKSDMPMIPSVSGIFNNLASPDDGKLKSVNGEKITALDLLFYNCTSPTGTLFIPDSIKSIGRWAFRGCSKINQLIIPESVEEIDEQAFTGCSHLKYIDVRAETPPSFDDYDANLPFDKNEGLKIFVPDESVDVYKSEWYEYEDYIIAKSEDTALFEIELSGTSNIKLKSGPSYNDFEDGFSYMRNYLSRRGVDISSNLSVVTFNENSSGNYIEFNLESINDTIPIINLIDGMYDYSESEGGAKIYATITCESVNGEFINIASNLLELYQTSNGNWAIK